VLLIIIAYIPTCSEIMKTRMTLEKTMAPTVSQVRRFRLQRFRQARRKVMLTD
jgi:hypothetical protein